MQHAVFIGSIILATRETFQVHALSAVNTGYTSVYGTDTLYTELISTCHSCFSPQALQGVALLQLRHRGFSGYHQGNNEVLPQSVALTETLAVSSLWVWLIAGFTTAAVRMLDEDADGLPIGPRFYPHAFAGLSQ